MAERTTSGRNGGGPRTPRHDPLGEERSLQWNTARQLTVRPTRDLTMAGEDEKVVLMLREPGDNAPDLPNGAVDALE